MTLPRCQRVWQVEATRDGRLSGSDLSNALRHRAECADCKQAARAFDDLARGLKTLPVPELDPLAHRRARQALLAAWNTQLLAEPGAKFRHRVYLTVACCAIGGVALAFADSALRKAAQRAASPSVQRTLRDVEPPLGALPAPPASSGPAPSPRASANEREPDEPVVSSPAKVRVTRSKRSPGVAPDTAEDDTYLEILTLLRNGREPEARAKAREYLQRFPRGFRRSEVAKVAAR